MNLRINLREGKPYALLMELQIPAVTMKNSMDITQKIKNRTTI